MRCAHSRTQFLTYLLFMFLTGLPRLLPASLTMTKTVYDHEAELWDGGGLSGYVRYTDGCLNKETLEHCHVITVTTLRDTQPDTYMGYMGYMDYMGSLDTVQYLEKLRQGDRYKRVSFNELPDTRSGKHYVEMHVQVGEKHTFHSINLNDDIYDGNVNSTLQHVIALSLQSDFLQMKNPHSKVIKQLTSDDIADNETVIELSNYYSLGFQRHPDTDNVQRIAVANCDFKTRNRLIHEIYYRDMVTLCNLASISYAVGFIALEVPMLAIISFALTAAGDAYVFFYDFYSTFPCKDKILSTLRQ